MESVKVSDLKAHLSHYLRMVRRGSEVQILDRGEPVARLVGLATPPGDADDGRVTRLAEAGVLRRGTGDLSWLAADPPPDGATAELSTALLEDREDRL